MADVILVDKDDNEIGIVSRDEAHRKGLIHRIAVIYVVNKHGQILIQERISGRLDHSSAGHVDVGESYEQTAKRELAEELGITDVSLKSIGKSLVEESPNEFGHTKHMYECFVAEAEPGKLQEEEVKSVFWQTPEAVLTDMETNADKYTGGFKDSLKLFLKSRK